jgi:NAD(P)-dependent dehydrogenase (short-subunit alcohol dehydrogenase family)
MSTVVITGSTRGIGRGLASEFVQRGHSVVISSRNGDDGRAVAADLSAAGTGQAAGTQCDVSDPEAVQALWDFASGEFGQVDFWINNAGYANTRFLAHELPVETVETLVDGNLKGAIDGSQVAMRGRLAQGNGALYNMLGGSYEGKRLTPNMGIYSATKAGIFVLSRYLVEENRDSSVLVGMISPGMLITENFVSEQKHVDAQTWQKLRPVLNVLCDHVETATPWLTEQILANRKHGHRIAWMSGSKIGMRFLHSRLPGGKRDLFSRYGL